MTKVSPAGQRQIGASPPSIFPIGSISHSSPVDLARLLVEISHLVDNSITTLLVNPRHLLCSLI